MPPSCFVPDVDSEIDSIAALSAASRKPPYVLRLSRRHCIASRWSLSRSKRTMDIVVAMLVLLAFSIPMALIALCVRLTSRGPAIFAQRRVGRGGRLFTIYKFRSMCMQAATTSIHGLTCSGDQRVTQFGSLLRKFKLDELPQFYNVLRGDMSLVGPRPKLPQYATLRDMPFRPGITGAASLAFRNEEAILGQVPANQMDQFYNSKIRPLKARMDMKYMARATAWTDLSLIWATAFAFASPARTPATLRPRSPVRVLRNLSGAMSEAE